MNNYIVTVNIDMSAPPGLHQSVRDRADLPRIEVTFPAAVVLDDGDLLEVSGLDISRGGIGISCDGATARAMVAHGSLTTPDAGAELHVKWTLPGVITDTDIESRPTLLDGRVRLAWSRSMGDRRHRIGFEFVHLDERARGLLRAYIEHEMQ